MSPAVAAARVAGAAAARQKEELEARKREAAEKAAAAKREREAIKAQLAKDRGEVAARGPAQASVAKALPTESRGSMTSAVFSQQEEEEGRRNAQ